LVSRSSTRADSTRRDRALALKPDYVEAWHNRGRVLQHLGRLDDALASYQRAVTLSPGLAESFNNSGAVLPELGRFEEALVAFERAAALKPDLAGAWLSCGGRLVELKQFDKAVRCIDAALARDPHLAEAWLSWGNVCGRLGRHEEARAAFDRALAISPDLVGAWVGRGNVLCESGSMAKRIAAMTGHSNSISAWPRPGSGAAMHSLPRSVVMMRWPPMTRRLVLMPALSGRGLAAAMCCASSAASMRRLPPMMRRSTSNLVWLRRILDAGNVFSELRQEDDALLAYGKAVALQPDLAEAWLGRGHLLRAAGRFADALAAYTGRCSSSRSCPEFAARGSRQRCRSATGAILTRSGRNWLPRSRAARLCSRLISFPCHPRQPINIDARSYSATGIGRAPSRREGPAKSRRISELNSTTCPPISVSTRCRS
jgi:protein O-GlcNAc transferase